MARRVPVISVCVPAYQAGSRLRATIHSVLAQNFTDFELIVLDNGSTDGTAELVGSFDDPRIRLVRREITVPMTENWNRVVGLARGELVKLLCADDLLRPDCLRVQRQVLAALPHVVMTACRRDFVDGRGRRLATGNGLAGLLGSLPDLVLSWPLAQRGLRQRCSEHDDRKGRGSQHGAHSAHDTDQIRKIPCSCAPVRPDAM